MTRSVELALPWRVAAVQVFEENRMKCSKESAVTENMSLHFFSFGLYFKKGVLFFFFTQ